ncbi:MAG: hypothetical protein KF709_13055 [Gemmatimonadaceae bacterium]|nr:hypothetical protein [Gemmatimonadaceae bacterium]
MPIHYRIDPTTQTVYETWTGTVNAEQLGAYWSASLRKDEFLTCGKTIADVRAADVELVGADLQVLIQGIAVPLLAGRRWLTAVVVASPSQFGTARQYEVFSEVFSTGGIFHDLESAEAWLAAQSEGR